MPKLKAELFGVPDGEVYPRIFEPGAECPPELEAAAQDLGVLETAEEAEARGKAEGKAMKAAENKALKVEENK